METNFIFIHGWGMDTGVWDKITTHLPAKNSYFINIGFTGEETYPTIPTDKPAIYITHSLGTAYALKRHKKNMNALIAINGFSNFTNFVEERTLQTMQKRLARNPSAQMQSFWHNCGIDEQTQNTLDPRLNKDKLQEGLEWLINWDTSKELNALPVPILPLGGDKDLILPLDKMKEAWSGFDLKIKKDGNHILPLSHPEWCIEKIKEFIGELKLER